MTTSQTTSIEQQFCTIDGLRIRYADTGGSDKPVVLLTSPWPESIFAFAPMWSTLAQDARLYAIDLPGFGASERRQELMSPRAMAEFLSRLFSRKRPAGLDAASTAEELFDAYGKVEPNRALYDEKLAVWGRVSPMMPDRRLWKDLNSAPMCAA